MEAAPGWVYAAVERWGVPLAMLAIVVVVGWRFVQTMLNEIRADRDHYRQRCEAGEDRVRDLARDLVNELREWRGENGKR